MDDDLLLGIDIGTQGVKGALVNAMGKIIAEASVEQCCSYPQPGWAEHDMERNWWLNPVRVIRSLLKTEGVRSGQVKALCPSGLHPNFGPVDATGQPLRGAILYSDNRAVKEMEEINNRWRLKLTSEELTPKLIWFLRQEPTLAARMKMFFDAAHFLVYRLTGKYITDSISVGGWGAIYHAPTNSWKVEVCEELGIPLGILPGISLISIVGRVQPAAAAATGLVTGTYVLAGTNDVTASSIGAGAIQPHEAIAYYGTAGLLPVMKVDMENAVRNSLPFAERGLKPQDGYLFDYTAYCLSTGDSARWFRDEFGQLEHQKEINEGGLSAYARYDQLAEQVPPGADGLIFLPYLLGQRSPDFNPQATGLFFGVKRLHTRGHFFRAILEAWGLTIRYGLERFYPQGHPLERLVATGGGARSRLWRQVVSDITGINQEYVPVAEGTLADAYLAGMALGWFKDFGILTKEWIHATEITIPDLNRKHIYDCESYPVFVELHDLLRSFKPHH
jgi:xylulokinase